MDAMNENVLYVKSVPVEIEQIFSNFGIIKEKQQAT
jgi:hypothetical protein